MNGFCLRLASAFVILSASAVDSLAETAEPLAALRDFDPSIVQDIRYATAKNFTGAVVPGYVTGECLLRPAAARALAKVQADLRERDPPLSLKVYDCYRPERSVLAFVEWAERGPPGERSPGYHPRLGKADLFRLGYIARTSRHSRGIAVDLNLVEREPANQTSQTGSGTEAGSCIGRWEDREPDTGVDMGTGFDCFDEKSHAGAAGLTSAQTSRRRILRDAMVRRGFKPYSQEWWHFSYPAADDGSSFDTPVEVRPKP